MAIMPHCVVCGYSGAAEVAGSVEFADYIPSWRPPCNADGTQIVGWSNSLGVTAPDGVGLFCRRAPRARRGSRRLAAAGGIPAIDRRSRRERREEGCGVDSRPLGLVDGSQGSRRPTGFDHTMKFAAALVVPVPSAGDSSGDRAAQAAAGADPYYQFRHHRETIAAVWVARRQCLCPLRNPRARLGSAGGADRLRRRVAPSCRVDRGRHRPASLDCRTDTVPAAAQPATLEAMGRLTGAPRCDHIRSASPQVWRPQTSCAPGTLLTAPFARFLRVAMNRHGLWLRLDGQFFKKQNVERRGNSYGPPGKQAGGAGAVTEHFKIFPA